VQRAELRPRHDGVLGLPRPLARLIEVDVDEGVQALIAGLDPPNHVVHDLDRRDLPSPDPARQLSRRRL
jgi:hypothetical protein